MVGDDVYDRFPFKERMALYFIAEKRSCKVIF